MFIIINAKFKPDKLEYTRILTRFNVIYELHSYSYLKTNLYFQLTDLYLSCPTK